MEDLISRVYVLAEYDRQHKGPPGGARKIITEAPAVETVPWKVQKPRLLLREDFEDNPNADTQGFLPCWVECNEQEIATGIRLGAIKEGETLDGWTEVTVDEMPGGEHHNPNVRYWTGKPTDKQMRETAWATEK